MADNQSQEDLHENEENINNDNQVTEDEQVTDDDQHSEDSEQSDDDSAEDQGDEEAEDDENAEDDASGGDSEGDEAEEVDEDVADDEDSLRKKRANDEYKARVARRNEQEAKTNALLASANKYVEAAKTPEDKRMRQLEANEYVRTVQTNQRNISDSFERAGRDFDIFREFDVVDGKQVINPKFNQRAHDLALQDVARQLQTEDVKDPNTGKKLMVITGSTVDVYKFLKERAEVYGDLVSNASDQGQRDGQRKAQRNRMRRQPDHVTSARGTGNSGDDSKLSAAEYAKKHNLKRIRA